MCKLTSYNRSLEEKNYLESCRNVVEVDQEIRELEQQKQKILKASQKPSPRKFRNASQQRSQASGDVQPCSSTPPQFV